LPARKRLSADEAADELIAAYARAQNQIDAELAEIVDIESATRRRRRLVALSNEIESLRRQLDQQAQEWTDQDHVAIYEAGAVEAGIGSFSWTQLHVDAINDAASRTYNDLLAATEHMTSDAKKLIRNSAKKEVLDKLIMGRTAVQAGTELRGELARNGISAVIYRDGSRHGIADYADMVLRTASATSYNVGALNQGTQEGAKYAVLHDGIGCCLYGHHVGPAANGLVVPLSTALAYPISHPRCRRSVSILPSVQTKRQADEAMRTGEVDGVPIKPTEAQDQAQLAAQQERTAALTGGRKRLAARQARLDRRLARIQSRQGSAS
jgi:hypothetical protein